MAEKKLEAQITVNTDGLKKGAKQAEQAVNEFGSAAAKAPKQGAEAVAKLKDEFHRTGKAVSMVTDRIRLFGLAVKDLKSISGGLKGIASNANLVTAILQKGLQSIGKIASFVIDRIREKQLEAVKRAEGTAKELEAAAERSWKRTEGIMAGLSALQELNQAEELSETRKAKQVELVNQLTRAYGNLHLQYDEAAQKVVNLDQVTEQLLEKQKRDRGYNLKSQINEQQIQVNFRSKQANKRVDEHSWTEDDAKAAADALTLAQERLRVLKQELKILEKSDPAGDYRRRREAEEKDKAAAQLKADQERMAKETEAREREEAAEAERLARLDEAAREREIRGREQELQRLEAVQSQEEAARAAYAAAVQRETRAREQAADEERRRALAKAREQYGFSFTEGGFIPGEGRKARKARRRRIRLDEGIAAKIARADRGEEVKFTKAEKRRMGGLQQVEKEAAALEEEIAAKARRRERAERDAALAAQRASWNQARTAAQDIAARLGQAGETLGQVAERLRTTLDEARAVEGPREEQPWSTLRLDNPRREALEAPGAPGAAARANAGSGDQVAELKALRQEVRRMAEKGVYIVR